MQNLSFWPRGPRPVKIGIPVVLRPREPRGAPVYLWVPGYGPERIKRTSSRISDFWPISGPRGGFQSIRLEISSSGINFSSIFVGKSRFLNFRARELLDTSSLIFLPAGAS